MNDVVTDIACPGAVSRPESHNGIRGTNRQEVATPFTVFRRVRRFGSLDGWRACAILAVIWHHTLGNTFATAVAQEGRHGVTLFFVISGFLIITIILRLRESTAGFSLWKFWGRRCLRILPIYYGILAVYVVLVRYTDNSPSGTAFFGNIPIFISFTTNWFADHGGHTIFYFSWSIAVEEQFYLVWPLIEVFVAPPLLKFILLGVISISSQIASFHTAGGVTGNLPVRIIADVPLGITLGTMLAHVLHHEASFRIAYRFLGRHGSAYGCLGLVALVAVLSPRIGFAGEVAIPLVFLLLVAATVIREDNDLAGLLSWLPVVWIGTVSYGMYMMHMLAINIVTRIEARCHLEVPALRFVGGAAVAVALASLSFVYYERPILGLKDRFFRDYVTGR